jgi:hypothetical protein
MNSSNGSLPLRGQTSQNFPEGSYTLTRRNSFANEHKSSMAAATATQAREEAAAPPTTDLVDQAHREGRASVKRMLLFFIKLLGPTLIIVLYMVTISSLLSWAVPNKLCKEHAMDYSVSSRSTASADIFVSLVPPILSLLGPLLSHCWILSL